MRFEVNGRSYMLGCNSDDHRCYLLTSRFDGQMKAIPVINGDELGFVANTDVPLGDAGPAIIN